MNHFSYIIYIIILSLNNLSKENHEKDFKYISIEFYSKYPAENNKNYFHENITKNYLFSKVYLGSNEQIIEMKLDLNYYETYILSNKIADKQLSFFNKSLSHSFKTYDNFYPRNNEFSSGVLSSDDLIILNNTNKIKLQKFYLAYVEKGFKNFPGSIGFSLYKTIVFPKESMNLISQLKNKSFISECSFTFKFDNNDNIKKNYGGRVYIGADYEKINPTEMKKYKKYIIKSSQKGLNEGGIWQLDINEIYLGNNEYKIDLNKKAQFDFKYDFIIASDEYSNMIYKIFFKELFSSMKCFRENFVYYSYFYAVKCIKTININLFPDLIFDFSSQFEKSNLILDYNDLFEIKDDFIFFKIILTWSVQENININENWIFGKNFFNNFILSFNQERKDITIYYKQKEKNNDINNINNKEWIFLVLIILVIVLSGIICFLIYKFYKQKKIFKNKNRINFLNVELTESSADKNE